MPPVVVYGWSDTPVQEFSLACSRQHSVSLRGIRVTLLFGFATPTTLRPQTCRCCDSTTTCTYFHSRCRPFGTVTLLCEYPFQVLDSDHKYGVVKATSIRSRLLSALGEACQVSDGK